TFLPSLLAPPIAPEHWFLTNVAARGVTSSMACCFASFAMVTVQGALLNLLPGRVYARCSGYVQGISAAIFFLCALESWHVVEWADAGTFLESFAWAPPVWFVCLQTDLLGRGNDSMQALGERAVWASAAALVSAVAIYFVSYWRYRNLLLESSAPARTAATRGFNWIELLVRDPRRAAVLEFMDKTLSRSRAHRMTLLGYGGLAFGLLINSVLLALAAAHWRVDWDTLLRFMVLYWPLTASMILIPGMRHALSVPVELNANWIFRIHESLGRAQWMSAVEMFVLAYAVLPVFVLLTPAAIMVLGWAVGLRMVTLESLAALSIFEFLFYSWQKLPFTCAYTPGKKPLASTVGRYLAAIYFLAPALSAIIATASQLFAIFVVFACGFAALWLWARRQRLQGWGESRLLYEDDDETPIGLGVKT
ncbi:MAG TPA: hypothetical protein VHW24_01595, partial [Bryobacteraceae bacterium]|nr:hypothetical protein [Bryobacteraceae bacterium]